MSGDPFTQLSQVWRVVAEGDTDGTGVSAGWVAEVTGMGMLDVSACLHELAARHLVRLRLQPDPRLTRAMPYRRAAAGNGSGTPGS